MLQRRSVPAIALVTAITAALGGCSLTDAGRPDGRGGESDPRAASEPQAPDEDGDGVADAADRCAGTRAGRPVDAGGCDYFDGVAQGVGFEPGSDTLTTEAREVLSGVAATLREHPAIDIAIEVHTDNRGAADDNLELSGRRALVVARYLAAEGVEPERLRPKAYGESRPLVSNATGEGRAKNRRVELTVLE